MSDANTLTNEQRAEAARVAICKHAWMKGDPQPGANDLEEAMIDLLADLQHLARSPYYGIDFDNALRVATMHADEEESE